MRGLLTKKRVLFIYCVLLLEKILALSCPDLCNCYHGHNNTLTTDCSSLQLSYIDRDISVETSLLNMSHNRLGTVLHVNSLDNGGRSHYMDLITEMFSNSDKLKVLDLSYNMIDDNPVGFANLIPSVRSLILTGNNITTLKVNKANQSSPLELLDISINHVTALHEDLFKYYPNLSVLHLDHNFIKAFQVNFSLESTHNIEVFTVSHNNIDHIDPYTLKAFSKLQVLNLSHNNIINISNVWKLSCGDLHTLALDNNPIAFIPNEAFHSCSSMVTLDISNTQLSILSRESFTGLNNLKFLNLSRSSIQVIHSKCFHPLLSLHVLDISNNYLVSLFPYTFLPNHSRLHLHVQNNPWLCNCDIIWLLLWLKNNTNQSEAQCSSPDFYRGLSLVDLPAEDIDCGSVQIRNNSLKAYYRIGSSAVLDCGYEGSPMPNITWTTPWREVFHFHPPSMDYPHFLTGFDHTLHYWHTNYTYILEDHGSRIYLLPNGSLYIDYITRSDAGTYTCYVSNMYGNDSANIDLSLNYLVIFDVTFHSIMFGIFCAGVFFLFGIVIGVIRLIVDKCSATDKETHNGIVQVLHNLNDYRSAKFGKLSAFKSAKMDQLSAFKNAKVGQLRTYKQATLDSVLQHMQTLREHYMCQMTKVKENCTQQVEKLRENYGNQAKRFKVYKSSQVGKLRGYKHVKIEQLRDHYHGQALKIREYGSVQMARLREQYKVQQQHLLKLLELLDVGNCMSAIEAECMRTDSMVFNDSLLDLNFDPNPEYMIINLDDAESKESIYVTASSHSDTSCNEKPLNQDKVNVKRRKKSKKKRANSNNLSDNACGMKLLSKQPRTACNEKSKDMPEQCSNKINQQGFYKTSFLPSSISSSPIGSFITVSQSPSSSSPISSTTTSSQRSDSITSSTESTGNSSRYPVSVKYSDPEIYGQKGSKIYKKYSSEFRPDVLKNKENDVSGSKSFVHYEDEKHLSHPSVYCIQLPEDINTYTEC